MSTKRQTSIFRRLARNTHKSAAGKYGKLVFSSTYLGSASSPSRRSSGRAESKAFREYVAKITEASNYFYRSEGDEIDRMIATTEGLKK